MNTENFFEHWGIDENPFRAEEARDDPVLKRLMKEGTIHPDFEKIFGQPNHPHGAVVFGEKGSGKTALRLLMEDKIRAYNAKNPNDRTWIVQYDDLNPILDRFLHNQSRGKSKEGLAAFRLEDHIDAIMSLTVTDLIDQILMEAERGDMSSRKLRRKIRWMSRQKRLDLGELCILYDQPQSGVVENRWAKMRRLLRLGSVSLLKLSLILGVIMVLFTIGTFLLNRFYPIDDWKPAAAMIVSGVSALLLLGCWAFQSAKLGGLVKRVLKELHVVDREPAQLKYMLAHIPPQSLPSQPLPMPGEHDTRYQLMRRLVQILGQVGYQNILVLFDRVDEPTSIKGDPDKMRQVVWPLFDNKFLQQENFGIKMLLPVELRHMLKKEDAAFYQKARLDKQHMVDRLLWSGATLYDLCNRRLEACAHNKDEVVTLRTLFDESVTEQDIIDALSAMEQPRDAFKFIYNVILEHCRNSPNQNPTWQIPKLTLDFVRREQSQRLQDLQRGLSPA